jgi:SAM-dependent methyltransferase
MGSELSRRREGAQYRRELKTIEATVIRISAEAQHELRRRWAVQHESRKFLGWQPACDCAATGTIPGTVLDPFAGSGTTLAVAAEQGRNAIGCELNAEYIALAKKRIREARESVALFDGIS